jgi:hypothetical protein
MEEAAMTKKLGLYVSYNEKKNGSFDEAVRISNELGCVTWFDNFPLNPQELPCPTDVFIRLTGEETYFRGTLLAIVSADSLPGDFANGERNHRPSAWRKQNESFQSVFFISCLQKEDSKPREIENKEPPQHPIYVDLLNAD